MPARRSARRPTGRRRAAGAKPGCRGRRAEAGWRRHAGGAPWPSPARRAGAPGWAGPGRAARVPPPSSLCPAPAAARLRARRPAATSGPPGASARRHSRGGLCQGSSCRSRHSSPLHPEPSAPGFSQEVPPCWAALPGGRGRSHALFSQPQRRCYLSSLGCHIQHVLTSLLHLRHHAHCSIEPCRPLCSDSPLDLEMLQLSDNESALIVRFVRPPCGGFPPRRGASARAAAECRGPAAPRARRRRWSW